MSEPKCKCFFGTESRRPWQPTCESATQPATSDAHSGNVHGCFFVQQLQALRKTLYSGAAQATRVPRWPCTALSRPASPPSYLPSLSKLWKSPADLQPSCHSENVRCRRKSLHLLLPPRLSLETSCTCRMQQFHRRLHRQKIHKNLENQPIDVKLYYWYSDISVLLFAVIFCYYIVSVIPKYISLIYDIRCCKYLWRCKYLRRCKYFF